PYSGDGQTAVTIDAPLDRLPLLRRSSALVPMFALAADTLEPATDGAVTSFADDPYRRELRILTTDDARDLSLALFDGATAQTGAAGGAFQITLRAGSWFDIVTVELSDVAAAGGAELDGAALPLAADAAALATCAAPGCYTVDPARGLLIRAHLPDASAHTVAVVP
ncbi:MAG TPA: hypothetical protein VL172_05085, partial [Kofleriaceae bacterium]|nr:hypothetical protein [Kofleriaceae bacterium]